MKEQEILEKYKTSHIDRVSKRRFWKIEYERWTEGFDGGDYTEMGIYWGTWWEAAREVVASDESVCRPKWKRKVEPFDLPDTKRKRYPFYVA